MIIIYLLRNARVPTAPWTSLNFSLFFSQGLKVLENQHEFCNLNFAQVPKQLSWSPLYLGISKLGYWFYNLNNFNHNHTELHSACYWSVVSVCIESRDGWRFFPISNWKPLFVWLCWCRPTVFVYTDKLCGRPPQYAPAPCKLTFWLWKWCPSNMWHGLPQCQFYSSYGPLCTRQTDVRRASSLNASALWGRGVIIINACSVNYTWVKHILSTSCKYRDGPWKLSWRSLKTPWKSLKIIFEI